MNANFWDEKYSVHEYIFGTEPNEYFKSKIEKIKPGKILVPAAGEGRDAVYAAALGWSVFAFDQSKVAKEKALKLCDLKKAEIYYKICDAFDYKIEKEEYDAVVLIFFHLPSEIRRKLYKKLIAGLKKGGHLILESFNTLQLDNSSGGPKDPDMLLSAKILEQEFSGLKIIENYETGIYLKEGSGHVGRSDVVRFFAVKE